MSKGIRNKILTIISLMAVFSFVFPLTQILRMFAFHYGTFEELVYYLGIFLAGFLVAQFVRIRTKGKIPVLVAGLTILIPVVCSFAIFNAQGILRVLFELIVTIIFYLIGIRSGFAPFFILQGGGIAIGAASIAVSMFIAASFQEYMQIKSYATVFAYIFLASVLILRNQSGLDETFLKRHIDTASVPTNIRKYNSMLVLGIFGVIIILINSKSLVAGIAELIRSTIIAVIWAIYYVMLFFSKFFGQGSGEKGSGEARNMLPDMGEDKGNGIANLILNIALGLVMLGLLYWLIKRIPLFAKFIMNKIRMLSSKIMNIIERFFNVYEWKGEESDDYQDEIQTVKPGEKSHKRQVRKQLRAMGKSLDKISDPVEKTRYLYRILLLGLKEENLDVKESDTTGEILVKTGEMFGEDMNLKDMTQAYNETRYGQVIPLAEIVAKTEEKCKEMLHFLKHRKN